MTYNVFGGTLNLAQLLVPVSAGCITRLNETLVGVFGFLMRAAKMSAFQLNSLYELFCKM